MLYSTLEVPNLSAVVLAALSSAGSLTPLGVDKWAFAISLVPIPLGAGLRFGGVIALVAIVAAVFFGFELGTWFSVAMVGFAGAAILYDTSNVLHRYPEDRYISAALQLFASVAMMFWYILRMFMSGRN